MSRYILAVDQSTQSTKGLLFDENGVLACRADRSHRQIINSQGWVEHDPLEIYENTVRVCGDVIEKAGISPKEICALGISNQRETSLMWDRVTGEPIYNAIVWQCSRAEPICRRDAIQSAAAEIKEKTGLNLSPYFPAAKLAWLMENVPQAKTLAEAGTLSCGTVDSWLVYRLTGNHKTDYSNASRTQLYNIDTLSWDEELCRLFEIPMESLPQVCMSDSCFGETTLDGLLSHPIPVHAVLGDSHGALFGQNCRCPGRGKGHIRHRFLGHDAHR